MNRVLLAIPSKNRAGMLQSHLLWWITRQPHDYRIFVEPQDEIEYVKAADRLHVVALGDNNRGLGYSKQCIGEYAVTNGYDYIFKIDDDVAGWTGRGKGAKKKSPVNFVKLLDDCLQAFEKYPDVKGIGFPYRHELYEVKKWIGVNARLQTCYLVRTEWWHADENLSIFEDFAQYLYIRAKNGIVLRYGMFGMDCEDVGKVPGGHQEFDRREQSINAIKYLKNIYPALRAKKVDKPWKIEPELKGEFFASKKL